MSVSEPHRRFPLVAFVALVLPSGVPYLSFFSFFASFFLFFRKKKEKKQKKPPLIYKIVPRSGTIFINRERESS